MVRIMDLQAWLPLAALLLGLVCGVWATWVFLSGRQAPALVAKDTEIGLLRDQVERLSAAETHDETAAAALRSVTETLGRVERQVAVLERDRVEQFGEVGARLAEVSAATAGLRSQTADLVGSLNSSAIRGTWGENQLRRVLEHAGMLPRCDFDEQVRAVSAHDAAVRPDVVVRLPAGRVLVVDAKVPLSAYLAAQADGLDAEGKATLLQRHADALRAHVQSLAGKEYWSAFVGSPEFVVCFVPSDAMLSAAMAADPALFDEAQAARVVLASPGTLLALMRAVAFTWQQDALADHARELLTLGGELHARISTLGQHLTRMGGSLRRSVESYNSLVGALEARVLVTARRMHDLGVATTAPRPVAVLEIAPRPLTSTELLDGVEPDERSPVHSARPSGRQDAVDEAG